MSVFELINIRLIVTWNRINNAVKLLVPDQFVCVVFCRESVFILFRFMTLDVVL